MKEIKLINLMLKNFKGIKEFELIANGNNTDIFGDNAVGKTTLIDAFMWLLFDKDSSNKKDFNIKTLDADGNVVHGLEHEVEGVLNVDNVRLIIKKIYKEKWTKKTGEENRLLTGHTTDYFIDGVPKKKKEYDAFINELADENLFKLITNVLFFNTELDWRKRRALLLEITGDISDDEVIKCDAKLDKLKSLIADVGIDDLKKKIAYEKKKLNEQIKQIPIRIDEIYKSIPEELDKNTYRNLEFEKEEISREIETIEKNIEDINRVNEEANKKIALISSKKMQLENIKFQIEKDATKEKNQLEVQKSRLENSVETLNYSIETEKRSIEQHKDKVQSMEKDLEALRKKWAEINKEEIIINDEFICPTCKQELPVEMKEQQIEQLKANFEGDKNKRLNNINSSGKDLKSEANKLKEMIVAKEENFNKCVEKLQQEHKELEEIKNKLKNVNVVIDYESNKDYIELKDEINELELHLRKPIGVNDRTFDRKRTFTARLNEINNLLANKGTTEKVNARIEELKKEERELANQITELEGQEYLTEQFIRTKVNLLEERINDKFKFAKFKMFNTLVNGSLEECCETVYDGVPYQDLNNAMKINIGLDIINTLAKHYGIQAPIFIDNAESINRIIDVESQVVRLVVSKTKKLITKNIHKVTEEEREELKEIVEELINELGDYDVSLEESVPVEFEFIKYEYGEKHRWWEYKYEYYRYKGQIVQFSCQSPLTEQQEGQETCPEIIILGDESEVDINE